MPERFVFRQVYTPDISLFARDGEIRARNHEFPQACHQTSYIELVERRGTDQFQMPCGGVVNDYVPFYFAPRTAFSFTIYRGNVQLRDPSGVSLGKATQGERTFVVYEASRLIAEPTLTTYFSNTALNNKSIEIEFGSTDNELESVVNWALFDDSPMVGRVQEIGYNGCCKYFHDRAEPEIHQDRKSSRMAEFLVKSAVPLKLASCLLTPNEIKKQEVEKILRAVGVDTPVYSKPGCFF